MAAPSRLERPRHFLTQQAGRVGRWVRSRTNAATLLLTLAVLTYSAYWSYVSILKFLALNDYIFDLGVTMQSLWSIYSIHWPLYLLAQRVTTQGIQFVLFPIALSGSYEVLLVAQSLAIGLAAYPLYGIARHEIGGKWVPLLVAVGYLLYFPLAGLSWFDAHVEAYFPLLFFAGFFFYLNGRLYLAGTLLLLSGTCGFLYMAFPLLLGISIALPIIFAHRSLRSLIDERSGRLALIVGGVSLLFLAAGFLLGGFGIDQGTGGYLHSTGDPLTTNLDEKIVTLVIVLAPFLFLPLFSLRGLLLLAPYAGVLFATDYAPYEFPQLISHQYGVLLVPAVFLGSIEGLRNMPLTHSEKEPGTHPHRMPIRTLLVRAGERRYRTAFAIILATLLLAMVYQPYGPLNGYSTANFNVAEETAVNASLDAELQQLIKLIPRNNPSVLIQDNLPQLLPGVRGNYAILPGFVGPNVTPSDIVTNRFPYTGSPGVDTVSIDYAIADLNNVAGFTYPLTPGFPGMYGLLREFEASGLYQVMGEASGLALVARNYSGPIQYFVPIAASYPMSEMMPLSPMRSTPSGLCVTDSAPGGVYLLWSGPYVPLPPGNYTTLYSFQANGSSGTDQVFVQATNNSNVFSSRPLMGSQFKLNSELQVQVNFTLGEFQTNVNFRGLIYQWTGTLCLTGVSVVQVGMPF